MSSPSTGLDKSPGDAARRDNALSLLFFLCVAVAFILRMVISPQMMNLVVEYTTDIGAFYEKVHFGTYAVFLLLPFVLFAQRFQLRADEIGKFRALLRYMALMTLLVLILFFTGRAGSSVFLIDTYLVTGAAGLIMLALNARIRRLIGDVMLIVLIVSAALGTIEALTRNRFMLYEAVELQFRATGLSEHPLALGALSATAIGFVVLTRWPTWTRIAAIFILVVGTAASGARMALLVAVLEVFVIIAYVPWSGLSPRHEKQAKTLVLLATALLGIIMIGVMFAAGLLTRFSSTLFDENFFVRLSIYDVFKYVSFEQVMFGMDGTELVRIVNEKLNMPTIESAQVVILMLFGLPLAIYFAWLVFWMIWRMLRHAELGAWIGIAAALLAALSNNTLSSKTPMVMIMIVLVLAYNANGVRSARTPAG